MNGPTRVGLATTVIAFLAGVWIFLAPFVIGYQDVGQDWIVATRNDMWTGGSLLVASAVVLLLFLFFTLRDAVRTAERRHAEAAGTKESVG